MVVHGELENEWPEPGLEHLGCCPLCGSHSRNMVHQGLTDNVFFCAGGKWNLYCCGDCETAYLDPRPSRASIHLAYRSYYTHSEPPRYGIQGSLAARVRRSLGNGYRNWRYGTRSIPSSSLGVAAAYLFPGLRSSIDALFRHVPHSWKGAHLLDVGFGSGAFLENAVAAGWDASGVDLDPVVVESAKARGLKVRVGGIEAFDSESECFDVVTISHVLEHLHDPLAALRSAYRLLKPGGMLWVGTPNLNSFGHAKFGASWRGLEAPRHLVLFTMASLDYSLEVCGFERARHMDTSAVTKGIFLTSKKISLGLAPDDPACTPSVSSAKLYGVAAKFLKRRSEFLTVVARKPVQ